jgi:hypothetical protein
LTESSLIGKRVKVNAKVERPRAHGKIGYITGVMSHGAVWATFDDGTTSFTCGLNKDQFTLHEKVEDMKYSRDKIKSTEK